LSKAEFERNTEYLRKAYDHGRRPMPFWILMLLSLLVILEGLGFSYLLGSWMALDSTANERTLLTVAIVIVLAAILVWVTHSAGHQLYRTRLLRSCFQQFQSCMIEANQPRSPEPGSTAEGPVRAEQPRLFSSEIVSLGRDQTVDDHLPPHVQCANRVITRPDDLGSYAWVWLAAVLVIVIALASIILRIETLHGSDTILADALPVEGGAGNPEAMAAALENAALASFTILSVIFIVTQMVGVGVGYWYGFAGKQSKDAYHAIRGCADYETYFGPVRRRMSIADLRLTTLHRLMERRLPREIHWTRDFLNFIRDERERGATDLQDPTALDPAPRESAPKGTNGASHPAAHEPEQDQVAPGPAPRADQPPASAQQ
jgi:hypothetical protein